MELIFLINNGITTAIVVFIFVCITYPHMIKHRAQFYGGFGLVVVMLLMSTLAAMIGSAGFARFAAVVNGFLQLGALLMVFMAAGGMSLGQLAGDIKGAFEVVRRGETEKEIIIPRSAQENAPSPGPTQVPPPPPPARDNSSVPLE